MRGFGVINAKFSFIRFFYNSGTIKTGKQEVDSFSGGTESSNLCVSGIGLSLV